MVTLTFIKPVSSYKTAGFGVFQKYENPFELEARIKSIERHIFFDEFEAAYPEIQTALKLSPQNPKLLYLKGKILEIRGGKQNLYEALLCYEQALLVTKKMPAGPEQVETEKNIYRNMGTVYLDLGNYALAEEYLKKALSLDPNFLRAKMALALCYQLMNENGNYEKAQEIYKSIDHLKYLEECAQVDHKAAKILQDTRLQEYFTSRNFYFVKTAIIYADAKGGPKNPPEKILQLANLYWQKYIKYVPDNTPRIGDKLPEDVFKEPEITVKDGYGDCDDAARFFDRVLEEAGIEHNLIIYRYAKHATHVICAFKLAGGWGYIDNEDLHLLNSKNIAELMGQLEIKPSEERAFIVSIRNRKLSVLKEIILTK